MGRNVSGETDRKRSDRKKLIGMEQDAREEVAEAGRVLSALGLVTAYGHVSARAGGAMLITPAADLATVTAGRIVTVPLDTVALPAGVPAEAWAHLALYRSRPDAAAIARAQPPSAFAAAAAAPRAPLSPAPVSPAAAPRAPLSPAPVSRAAASPAPASPVTAGAVIAPLAPLYGQAAWLGAVIPVHDGAALLRSAERAGHAARSLPAGEALLLRGNGALTLGATPGLAVARMWLLSAACDVYLSARAAGPVTPLSATEIASWRAVSAELLPRLWQHLQIRVNAQTARLR